MSIAIEREGGGARLPQWSTYTVEPNQALDSIAAEHRVTPQAIRQANPDVFRQQGRIGDPDSPSGSRWVGTELRIPPCALSAMPGAGAGTPPADAGVEWDPDAGRVTVTAGTSVSAKSTDKGKGKQGFAKVELAGETSTTYRYRVGEGDDGPLTHAQVGSTMRVTGSFTTEGRIADGSASHSVGREVKYEVLAPGRVSAREIVRINPIDPTTIPLGARVAVDASTFRNTALEGCIEPLRQRVGIAVESDITKSSGVGYTVEKTDPNTVRVTVGPKRAIDAYNALGPSVNGYAPVMFGVKDKLEGTRMQSADFNLATPDGQAAYRYFVSTGQLPEGANGVSNLTTTERLDFSSQASTKIDIGLKDFAIPGGKNSSSTIRTTHPDGSVSETVQLQYSGRPALQIQAQYDASGAEIPGTRTYAYTVQRMSSVDAALLSIATGQQHGSSDRPVTIWFSETQMRALMRQANRAAETEHVVHNPARSLVGGDGARKIDSPDEFSYGLARNQATGTVAETDLFGFLSEISTHANGRPGTEQYGGVSRIDAHVTTDG